MLYNNDYKKLPEMGTAELIKMIFYLLLRR